MSNPLKFGAAVVAMSLASALALSACSSSGSDKDTGNTAGGGGKSGGSYGLAVLTDLTGTFGSPGSTINAGIQAYTKMVNAKGGVNGKTIKLSVTDSQSSADGTVAGLRKAIADKPEAILQDGNSFFAALLPLLNQASDIPFFTAGATDAALYPSPTKNVFMIQASATQQAAALVAEMKVKLTSLSGKKFALLGGSAPYTDGLIAALKADLKKEGGALGDIESYNYGSLSFTSQAAKIAASKPAGVFHLGDTADSETGLKALVTAGITSVPILTYSSGSDEATLKGVGAANVDGLRTTVAPAPGTDILKAAQALGYGSKAVDNNFSLGWAEAATAIEGLRECGASCSSRQLLTKLESISSYTVPNGALFGPVSMSSTKHTVLSQGQFYKYEGSKVVADGSPVSMGE